MELQKAAARMVHFEMPASGVLDFRHSTATLGWMPVAGNPTLPNQPFDPKAQEISASVPMIVCNTLNEFNTAMNKPDALEMTEERINAH